MIYYWKPRIIIEIGKIQIVIYNYHPRGLLRIQSAICIPPIWHSLPTSSSLSPSCLRFQACLHATLRPLPPAPTACLPACVGAARGGHHSHNPHPRHQQRTAQKRCSLGTPRQSTKAAGLLHLAAGCTSTCISLFLWRLSWRVTMELTVAPNSAAALGTRASWPVLY